MGKLERSELKQHFTAVEVLAEKERAAYRGLVDKYGLVSDKTWMIGNSPSSDINPAIAGRAARRLRPSSQYLGAGARRNHCP